MTTRPEFIGPALRGDAFALNSLFDSCRPQVWSIALGICGNTPAAEDAVQDAFGLAYTRLSQLKDPAAFLPWICQIVRNCCYQVLRKEKATASQNTWPAADSLIEESIERHYDRVATRDSLYTSLSFLPEHLRSMMLLRYLSDYSSYQQIAEIMAIPVGAGSMKGKNSFANAGRSPAIPMDRNTAHRRIIISYIHPYCPVFIRTRST